MEGAGGHVRCALTGEGSLRRASPFPAECVPRPQFTDLAPGSDGQMVYSVSIKPSVLGRFVVVLFF